MEAIEYIAAKPLEYNRDINQHIISCRISLDIIKQKELELLQKENHIKESIEENNKLHQEIDNLNSRLRIKEEEIRQKDMVIRTLLEEKLRMENQKDREIRQYKQIINECYFQIDKLTYG